MIKNKEWFDQQDNKTAISLNNITNVYKRIFVILDKIDDNLIPDLMKRCGRNAVYRDSLEEHLKYSVNIEFFFFKMLENTPEIHLINKKTTKPIFKNIFYKIDNPFNTNNYSYKKYYTTKH